MLTPDVLLTLIVFLPAIGALAVAFMPSDSKDWIRVVTLGVTIAVMALVIGGLMVPENLSGGWNKGLVFDTAQADVQNVVNLPWIPSFEIDYFLALDGISFPLVVLTAFVCLLAMAASWTITKHVKAYCILFLLLETGMIGVFVSLDFFLFYVFWEVMLLPMYFLIGVWGGPRKEYAAIKFFLYTLLGSVLMLIAILMLYFYSDVSDPDLVAHLDKCSLRPEVRARAEKLAADRLPARDVVVAARAKLAAAREDAKAGTKSAAESAKEIEAAEKALQTAIADEAAVTVKGGGPLHTFNILALQQIGQNTLQFSQTIQWWCFVLLFIGFAIKVPTIPVHTWLPDAHVEAPTPISMILAGVLLKMGGYGIIRICYPICPHGGYDLMWWVCGIGVASMIYGAFAALAQKDFKRMVAYSSVSHMGYVVLGLGVWSARAETGFNSYFWDMGVKGAMFQMIAHGISSAGMFFLVGVVYDRVHHRNLDEFGGLFGKMPYYTALAMGIFFAALGLPGLCGFPGEFFVVMSVWKFSPLLAILSAAVVVLTAGYILWAVQRVYLGAEYKGPHEDHLTPSNFRENTIGTVFLFFAILFGVFPHLVLQYMDKTIDKQTKLLANWTAAVKEAQPTGRAVGNALRGVPPPVAAEPVGNALRGVPEPVAVEPPGAE
ncbi:MAG: NADH-quinone oxidoreductase subunit M [Planctomycetaceae bacterium]|nr:NADH-quinone oxidoreductase subunit M [Planctomycetaceae bacterium]